MVDSLSAFIRKLSVRKHVLVGTCPVGVQIAKNINSGCNEQAASLECSGDQWPQDHRGIHLDILLRLQNVQEFLDWGRQYKLCCYFQVLGSQKRSLFRIGLKNKTRTGQQQPGWWTHLPQHFSKAQRLGGPLPGFMEELLERSADLNDRPPAGRGGSQLVHTGGTRVQAQLVTNRQHISNHSSKLLPQISSMRASSYWDCGQNPGKLDPQSSAESTWVFHVHRGH